MIQLTGLNGSPLLINSDLIKSIENGPDTVISLVNGEKIVVRETGEQIVDRIVLFRRRVLGGIQMSLSGWASPRGDSAELQTRERAAEER